MIHINTFAPETIITQDWNYNKIQLHLKSVIIEPGEKYRFIYHKHNTIVYLDKEDIKKILNNEHTKFISGDLHKEESQELYKKLIEKKEFEKAKINQLKENIKKYNKLIKDWKTQLKNLDSK